MDRIREFGYAISLLAVAFLVVVAAIALGAGKEESCSILCSYGSPLTRGMLVIAILLVPTALVVSFFEIGAGRGNVGWPGCIISFVLLVTAVPLLAFMAL